MKRILRYSDLVKIPDFIDRFNYLRLSGVVGDATFGSFRYLNQLFYRSEKWIKARDEVIIRDNGCDLGHPDREIRNKIVVHHINPITIDDVEKDRFILYDPDNLICTTPDTHRAIHYGDTNLLIPDLTERYPNDTCPWR